MSVEEILIGPVSIFYAPVGETIPDVNTVVFGAAWGGNWTDVGYTKDDTPLSWNHEIERWEGGAQQTILKLKRRNISETLALETSMIEITADRLALAIKGRVAPTVQASGVAGRSELYGGGAYVPDEKTWGFEGRYDDASGNVLPVRLFIHKANSMINGALEFGRDDETGIALRVDALEDTSKAADERLFHLQIVTAPAL